MKSLKMSIAALSALSLLAGAGFAGEPMHVTKTRPNAGFEIMKPLVGNWQGKSDDGKPVRISYALASDGSVLVEKIESGTEKEMVTVYHPDGDRLLMTHYCSLHNQPRMRAEAATAESGTLIFDFVDATNMSSPDAMHMHRLAVTFEGKDRFVQEWTWKSGEKEGTVVFRLERKKQDPS
jgi:hypothetical protein